ncbi:MAG: CYTH domain-containing protein, partial [Lachnospiraceae bacterium]
METELKLSFKNTESLMDVASSDLFSEISVISGPKTMMLENYYLDTADMKILHRHGSVRKRIVKGEESYIEGTVKYGGGSSSGLHRRFEWNVMLDGDFSIEEFKKGAPSDGDPLELLDEVFENIESSDLKPLCFNSFQRKIYTLEYNGSHIEACFDSGVIYNSDKSASEDICELELELLSGSEVDLMA